MSNFWYELCSALLLIKVVYVFFAAMRNVELSLRIIGVLCGA